MVFAQSDKVSKVLRTLQNSNLRWISEEIESRIQTGKDGEAYDANERRKITVQTLRNYYVTLPKMWRGTQEELSRLLKDPELKVLLIRPDGQPLTPFHHKYDEQSRELEEKLNPRETMDVRLGDEVRQMLSKLVKAAPALTDRVTTDKIYELYILCCLAKALDSIGATMEARDYEDQLTKELRFRLKPGKIHNPYSDPGFILVSYQGQQYEIQNGLRVLGHSGVLHELDVCLIDRAEAERCRGDKQQDPRHTWIEFMAECKFYGNSLPLGLGREYLGLSMEFSREVQSLVSNVENPDVRRLLTCHNGTAKFHITPQDPDNVECFVQWLANELMRVL